MPHVGHQFRVRPGQPSVAPLAAPAPAEPDPFGGAEEGPVDAGFGEEEAGRIEPKPRARMAAAGASSAAAASVGAGAQAAAIPGSGSKNPLLSKLSVNDWDINPYRVAQDLTS